MASEQLKIQKGKELATVRDESNGGLTYGTKGFRAPISKPFSDK